MKDNVVIAVFEVESEAHQAFNQLKREAVGKGYAAPEAALIQNKANTVDVIDAYGFEDANADTSTGMVIGSLVGILGGPVGVLLGAATGALAGSVSDDSRAADAVSAVAVVADKIYVGEIAIAALVREDEPAFDAVFADYKTTIVRYDAADVADDVERLQDLGKELTKQMAQEAKADRKAERAERREEHRAKIRAGLERYAEANNRTMSEAIPN